MHYLLKLLRLARCVLKVCFCKTCFKLKVKTFCLTKIFIKFKYSIVIFEHWCQNKIGKLLYLFMQLLQSEFPYGGIFVNEINCCFLFWILSKKQTTKYCWNLAQNYNQFWKVL